MSQPMAAARLFPHHLPGGAHRRALERLRVVPAAIRRQGHGGFALMCIGLLTAGLLSLLMVNTTLGQGAFTMQDLRLRSTVLAGQEEALTQAINASRSPAGLAARASALGMVPSTSMAFVRLSDGKVIGKSKPTARTPGYAIVTSLTVPVLPPAVAKPARGPAGATLPAAGTTAPKPGATPAGPATAAKRGTTTTVTKPAGPASR